MNCNCRDDDAPLSEKISEAAALLFKSHGTATLWKQNPKVQVIPLNTPTYQMSASRVNVRNKTILNIGCYFPTTTTDKDQDYENYLAMLGEFIENNTQEDQEMIITADFNIHLQGDKNQSTQRRITAYEDFKQEYNLVETRPTSDTFFSKANESQSCLDWILTTKGVTVDFVETRKQTEFAHSSDHLPVMIKVKIECEEEMTKQENRVSDTNENFTKTRKQDWDNQVNIPMYRKILDYFVMKLPKEVWTMQQKYKSKIMADQINLASLIAKKKPGKKKAAEKKSKEIIRAEIDLTRLNLLIAKVEKDKENTPRALMMKLKQKRRFYRTVLRKAQKKWSHENIIADNQLITDLITSNSVNKIYEEFKKLNKTKATAGPDFIEVYGKRYNQEEVLRGFEKLTMTRSRNDRILKRDPHYESLKDINDMLRIVYRFDNSQITPMSDSVFKKLLADLPRKKAEDINNCGLEHIIHASEMVQDKIREMLNGITLDWTEYSDVLFNTVIANMLYKGKNKKRSDPMSYRRISIGSIFQKVLDRYMAEETNRIAKIAQGTSQYGFSKDINFLQLTVLRENVQKMAEETGKMMICLATDISDAFSQTTREAQMYECYKAGESGKVWLYSDATYTETYTVLKDNIKRLGNLIQEMKGSRQGGIKSAPDFKLYYLMLDRLIRTADMGYKIDEMEDKLYLQLVADDSMAWVTSPEELQAVVKLFEFYADKYAMQFCFPKTLVNCYGRKADVEKLRNSTNIQIAGNEPNFPEEAVHLGLIQCQENSRTESVNVRARIKKATAKLMNMFGSRFSSKMPMKASVNKLIWNTYIKPTALTGLNALTVTGTDLEELKTFEETILRRMFKVRNKASVFPIYDISGIEPIEATLHKQTFSLFYNFWLNPQTPASKVNKIILENPQKYKKNYWPTHVRELAAKYGIMDPLEILKEPITNKESWKKYVASKVNEYHNKKNKEKIENMKTTTFLVDKKRNKFNKTGRQYLNAVETVEDIKAASIKTLFLMDEYPTRVHDMKFRGTKESSRDCRICLKVGRHEYDNIPHALEFCSITQEDDIKALWSEITALSSQILETCPSRFSSYFSRNPGARATFILNTDHSSLPDNLVIGQHQTSPQLLNLLSRYCWLVHKHRTRVLHNPHSSDVENGRRNKKVLHGHQGRSTKGKDQSNKITRYLSEKNSQILKNADEAEDAINRWQNSGCPPDSDFPHQLLALVVNPGVASFQGTILWPEFPSRTVNSRVSVYRAVDWTNTGKLPFNGCLEILATEENIIKNLHVLTMDNFTKFELSSIIHAAPIILNATGEPNGLIPSEDKVSVSLITTASKTLSSYHVKYITYNSSVPRLFVGSTRHYAREDFAHVSDFDLVNHSPEVGLGRFMENIKDWRTKTHGDEEATILTMAHDNADEEAEKLTAAIRMTIDPAAHTEIMRNVTEIPGRSLSLTFNSRIQVDIVKSLPNRFSSSEMQVYNPALTVYHFNDDLYTWLSNELERLRLCTRAPEAHNSTGTIQKQMVDLTDLTKKIHTMIEEVKEVKIKPRSTSLTSNDLRHNLDKKRRSSSGKSIYLDSSSSSGVTSGPSAPPSPSSSITSSSRTPALARNSRDPRLQGNSISPPSPITPMTAVRREEFRFGRPVSTNDVPDDREDLRQIGLNLGLQIASSLAGRRGRNPFDGRPDDDEVFQDGSMVIAPKPTGLKSRKQSRFSTPTRKIKLSFAEMNEKEKEEEIVEIRRMEAMYSGGPGGYCALGQSFADRKARAGLSPPNWPRVTNLEESVMATDPRDEIIVENTKETEKKKTTSPDEMSYDDTLKDLEAVLGRPPWTTVEKDENSTTAPPASAAHAALLNRPPTPALGTPDRPIEIDTSNDALQIDVDERDLDFSLRPVEKTPPRRSIPSLSTSSPTATLDECKVMRFFLKCAWSNPDKEALRPIINIRERCLAKSLAELDLDYNSFMAGGPDPLTGRDAGVDIEAEDLGQEEVSETKRSNIIKQLINENNAGNVLRPPPVLTVLTGSNQGDRDIYPEAFMYNLMYSNFMIYFYLCITLVVIMDHLVPFLPCKYDLSITTVNKSGQILLKPLLSFLSIPTTLSIYLTFLLISKDLSALITIHNPLSINVYFSTEPLPDELLVPIPRMLQMEQAQDRGGMDCGSEKKTDQDKNITKKPKNIVTDREFLILIY